MKNRAANFLRRIFGKPESDRPSTESVSIPTSSSSSAKAATVNLDAKEAKRVKPTGKKTPMKEVKKEKPSS